MTERPSPERLMAAIQDGMPLTPRPFLTLATALGTTEAAVLEGVQDLHRRGVIKRLGLVVRHRTLGYRANAMVVWDVADDEVDRVGDALARSGAVTLCYRRPRMPPHWPYNLFCMIHGCDRGEVLERLQALVEEQGLAAVPRDVLFSTHCYKQRGGWYRPAPQGIEARHG